MAALVNSGRASATRLKVYLGIVCLTTGGDHACNTSAKKWAVLLDLPDPNGRGTRSIRNALKHLESVRLVRREAQAAEPHRVTLLREDGSGAAYTPSRKIATELREEQKLLPADQFILIPPGFWKNGWLATLSTPAIAALLALMHITRGGELVKWGLTYQQAADIYGFSGDTWGRGVRELADHGVVTVTKTKSEGFSYKRRRNEYTLKLKRLNSRPKRPSG